MKKYLICLCLGILVGALIHSVLVNNNKTFWKPVIEKTSFQYLDYSVEDIIKGIREAEAELNNNQKGKLDKTLNHTMNLLLKLEYYYLPVTEVRQLIFDADRWLSLNQTLNAKNNLAKAGNRLARIESLNGNTGLKKSIGKLDNLVKEAMLEIDGPYKQAAARLEAAGAEANLMLLKGELILSGGDETMDGIK
ncbi:MAG: hypothetical protein GXP56_17455 [Deltaproteobacteria bacterium]|nr:hypothetical protein [Deltaproteobacteria bacterium]